MLNVLYNDIKKPETNGHPNGRKNERKHERKKSLVEVAALPKNAKLSEIDAYKMQKFNEIDSYTMLNVTRFSTLRASLLLRRDLHIVKLIEYP